MQKIRKAVIPAAGFGTRFLPETKAMPKEMLPIVDKPTIQYIVEEIKASGIDQILIISGHAKRAIEDHFDSSPELEQHLYESGKMDLLREVRKVASVKIHYTRQQYMRGLGDAILCAKDFIDGEPFGVILGDDVVYNANGEPALRQLMDQYEKTGGTVIGCQVVKPEQVSSYGIVDGVKTDDPNLLKVKDMIKSLLWKKRPAVLPLWDAMSSHRKYSTCWNRQSPAKAGKSSSPTPSASWPTTAVYMPIISPASGMTRETSWAT